MSSWISLIFITLLSIQNGFCASNNVSKSLSILIQYASGQLYINSAPYQCLTPKVFEQFVKKVTSDNWSLDHILLQQKYHSNVVASRVVDRLFNFKFLTYRNNFILTKSDIIKNFLGPLKIQKYKPDTINLVIIAGSVLSCNVDRYLLENVTELSSFLRSLDDNTLVIILVRPDVAKCLNRKLDASYIKTTTDLDYLIAIRDFQEGSEQENFTTLLEAFETLMNKRKEKLLLK